MDPNQQRPRADYQSVRVERPQNYLNARPNRPVFDVAPPPESIAPPPAPAPVITGVESSPPPSQPAQPLLDPPAPEPLLEAHAQNGMVQPPTPVTRPWQTPAVLQAKPPIWKSQKFWLLAAITAFAVLLLAGVVIGYKATHHAADKKLPQANVTAVDTSSVVKTLGMTDADKAANKERQQDIINLRDSIEAYYTGNLKYPTTADMINPSWVTTNLKNITLENLKDPKGAAAVLATKPIKNSYAYQAGASAKLDDCENTTQNCNYYTLTAILSDGSEYNKSAMR